MILQIILSVTILGFNIWVASGKLRQISNSKKWIVIILSALPIGIILKFMPKTEHPEYILAIVFSFALVVLILIFDLLNQRMAGTVERSDPKEIFKKTRDFIVFKAFPILMTIYQILMIWGMIEIQQ